MKKSLLIFLVLSTFVSLKAQLSGNYTIGGASPDFATIVQAVDSLNRAGVSSAVTFSIRPGTYTGQVKINNPSGVSATNYVRFRPDSFSVAPVLVRFSATSSASGFRGTWVLNASRHIKVDSIRIEALGTSRGHAVEFVGSGSNVAFKGCVLKGSNTSTSSSYYMSTVFDDRNSANNFANVTFKQCDILGGSYGIYTYGMGRGFSNMQKDWTVDSCNIHDFYYMGVYGYYVTLSLTNNDVKPRSTTAYFYTYGFSLRYCNGSEIRKNNIVMGTSARFYTYGIYVYYSDALSTRKKMIANNMISCEKAYYAAYIYNSDYVDVLHNSFYTGKDYRTRESVYYYAGTSSNFINNIIQNDVGSTALRIIGRPSTRSHNCYYTTANTKVQGGTIGTTERTIDPEFISKTDLHIQSLALNGSGWNITSINSDIDGDTRTSSRDMGADEYTPKQNDLRPVALYAPRYASCGQDSTKIYVVVRNNGLASQSTNPVIVQITGSTSATLNNTSTKAIASNKLDTIYVGTINTKRGGNYNLTLITNLAGDQSRGNDTLKILRHKIYGVPLNPNYPTPIVACTNIDTTITTNVQSKTAYWYDDNKGSLIHTGDSLKININTPDTVWVQASDDYSARVGHLNNRVGVGRHYTIMEGGLYFNVLRKLTIDTVTVYPQNSGKVHVRLLDEGGKVVRDTSFTVTGFGEEKLPINFTVEPGENYRLDAKGTNTNGLWYTYSSVRFPYTDPDTAIVITQGWNGSNWSSPSTFQYYYFYDWKISVEGCESDLVRVPIGTRPSINVNLGNDTGYCVGSTINHTLNASNSAARSYRWHNGSTSPNFTVITAGNFWVDVTATNGCVSRDSIEVLNVPLPVVTFFGGNSCDNQGPRTYLGSPAGGSITGPGAVGGKFSGKVAGVGNHRVTYTYSDKYGCSGSATGVMKVSPAPTANYTATGTYCQSKKSIQLTGGSPAGGYYYGQNVKRNKLIVSTSGPNKVSYIYFDNNACSDTATQTITVKPSPQVTWSAIGDQCAGNAVSLSATPAGGTYSGTGVSGTSFNAPGAGKYVVKYSVTGSNGCVTTEEQEVQAYPSPNVIFSNLHAACDYDKDYKLGAFVNPSGGVFSGQHVDVIKKSFDVAAASPGTYPITYTVKNSFNCKTEVTKTLLVKSTPKANFGPDKQICGSQTVTLDAGNPGGKYVWSSGHNTQSITVQRSGKYTVTITSDGCRGIDSVKVSYEAICVSIDQKLAERTEVNVYPNPTSGVLNLDMKGFDQMNVQFVLKSINGQEVSRIERSYLEQIHLEQIDVSALSKGIYLLHIETDQGNLVYRISVSD